MCGICCILHDKNAASKELTEEGLNTKGIANLLNQTLERRGPDFQGSILIDVALQKTSDHVSIGSIQCIGTVLHLRGEETPQPLQDESGNILLWNGEIFSGDIQIPSGKNDGQLLLQTLNLVSKEDNFDEVFSKVFSGIKGPWAFIYWQANKSQLWFGRDYFGRRSLLWHWPINNESCFMLSSVAAISSIDWEEVPAQTLYCLNLSNTVSASFTERDLIKRDLPAPWSAITPNLRDASIPLSDNEKMKDLTQTVVPCCKTSKAIVTLDREEDFEVSSTLRDVCGPASSSLLNGSVNSNFTDNGNDFSALITATETPSLPLLPQASDNLTLEICASCIEHNREENDSATGTRIHDASKKPEKVCMCVQSSMLSNCCFEDSIENFIRVMLLSVQRRVLTVPRRRKVPRHWKFKDTMNVTSSLEGLSTTDSINNKSMDLSESVDISSRVGILFSGGIDSIFLAALLDRCLPDNEPVDLINVAFEKKDKIANHGRNQKKTRLKSVAAEPTFDVPDRITGRAGVLELNPRRCWNFVEVNVTLAELQEWRQKRVKNVVYPSNTVLDDSIGCAIWFAARGLGDLFRRNEEGTLCKIQTDYMSPVKVLLTGMGADEQLGGYARHRTKFEHSGWKGLMDEIDMELRRISSRNLGRDDRCISDHGREARFPFLDEDVVAYLQSLPVWIKCDPRLPRGIGEKILLREAAKKLGLSASAALPKRAIQFGSRIAKLESNSEKGSESCQRLR